MNNKKHIDVILMTVVAVFVVGVGTYFWFIKQKDKTISDTPVVSNTENESGSAWHLTYPSLPSGLAVYKSSKSFPYTEDDLISMAEECGTNYDEGYLKAVAEVIDGIDMDVYEFKYKESSQESGYVISLVPNVFRYADLDAFKKDFNICAAGATLYPLLINPDWLMFENSCGTGFTEDSNKENVCEISKRAIRNGLGFK